MYRVLPLGVLFFVIASLFSACEDYDNSPPDDYNPVPKPTASFSQSATNGYAPLSISFFNRSVAARPRSLTWIMGDGTTYTTLDTISHTYTTPGNYTVSLIVQNSGGADTATSTITVLPPYVPSFVKFQFFGQFNLLQLNSSFPGTGTHSFTIVGPQGNDLLTRTFSYSSLPYLGTYGNGVFMYDLTGQYYVRLRNPLGVTINMPFVPEQYFPTTPNLNASLVDLSANGCRVQFGIAWYEQ